MYREGIRWLSIFRLGLVQASIGAIVMLATSLLNRVMVVEYAVAAAIPAGLVAWHYAVQIGRPLWGHQSDLASRRTPWIILGMGVLALGSLMAVDAALMMGYDSIWPTMLAITGFTMIGAGVGMAGTGLLALLASRVEPARKPAAAAICWTMMVAGIVISAGMTGHFLDPFTPERLAVICSVIVLIAFCLAIIALRGVEAGSAPVVHRPVNQPSADLKQAMRDVWCDVKARRFTGFVFISMLAYSMQDLILEPFAGMVFGMTPGQSTSLAGVQHSGVLVGMVLMGAGGTLHARRYGQHTKLWIVLGCVASAIMLGGLAVAADAGSQWPLKANVFGLGLANGIFAVSAVGAMLTMASEGTHAGEGARMGVWGAAQAIAFGLGGLGGAVIVDQLRAGAGSDSTAFATVFAIEAVLFFGAAVIATGTIVPQRSFQREARSS